MPESILRSGKILSRQKAGLLVIDVQTKILATMHESKEITDNIVRLIQGVRTLNVPVFYTEQYPKGLGETAAPVKEALTGILGIQKMSFSCCGAPGLFQEFKKKVSLNLLFAELNVMSVSNRRSSICWPMASRHMSRRMPCPRAAPSIANARSGEWRPMGLKSQPSNPFSSNF